MGNAFLFLEISLGVEDGDCKVRQFPIDDEFFKEIKLVDEKGYVYIKKLDTTTRRIKVRRIFSL